MNLGRRLIVRQIVRGIRGGICEDELRTILTRRFRYRDAAWRDGVIEEARSRMRADLLRRLNA